MPNKDFDLGDYVEVKDRIRIFYELYAQGRLVTDDVTILTDPAGKQRVLVRGLAYRNPDDKLPGVGHSWLEMPGTTPYTKGSEVENAETSAWGRAIGALGILIDRSIATRQEIDNKADESAPPASTARRPAVATPPGDGGLVGTAVAQGTQDFNLRQSPDGWTLPFRIKDGGQTQIVVARDELALALDGVRDKAIGHLVTVWGPIATESFTKADKKITFNVLTAVRIKGDGFDIAAAEPDIDLDVVMADVPAA